MDAADLPLVARCALFHGVALENVAHVLERCAVRLLTAGEPLLQPDVPNHHLYLVLDGELDVELLARESLKHTTIGIGGCAGEISLVDGKLPSARVSATRPARVLVVPHDTVWALVDGSHAVARNLLGVLAGRMRNENRALVQSLDQSALFEHQASVDALTGLHNRRWMADAFPRVLQRCIQSGVPCALVVADVDRFKQVNDVHGHPAGDVVLRRVAEVLAQHTRPHDLLVRLGGEEFAMLLPGATAETARAVAERIRVAMAAVETRPAGVEAIRVTLSLGICAWSAGADVDAMMARADHALYRAKHGGRDRVELAEEPPTSG